MHPVTSPVPSTAHPDVYPAYAIRNEMVLAAVGAHRVGVGGGGQVGGGTGAGTVGKKSGGDGDDTLDRHDDDMI